MCFDVCYRDLPDDCEQDFQILNKSGSNIIKSPGAPHPKSVPDIISIKQVHADPRAFQWYLTPPKRHLWGKSSSVGSTPANSLHLAALKSGGSNPPVPPDAVRIWKFPTGTTMDISLEVLFWNAKYKVVWHGGAYEIQNTVRVNTEYPA